MAQHRVLSSDDDIRRAIAESSSLEDERHVVASRLEGRQGERRLLIEMSDGSVHSILTSRIEGLANATDRAASVVEISEDGLGLRWPIIDLDLFVPALIQGVSGTKSWMSSLGRAGGRVTSEAKRRAARLNGLKGGRPRAKLRVHLHKSLEPKSR